MSAPGSVAWFARHEARLGWRDWMGLITGGKRRRAWIAGIGFVVFTAGLHGLAWLLLRGVVRPGQAVDRIVLVAISATLAAVASLMLAQALESATRAFYARGDLELVMTSPAVVARLFGVRMAGMTVTIMVMVLALAAPFIDLLVWLGGVRWLGAYAVAGGMAMASVAVAVGIVGVLFRLVGPRRTRAASQVLAALVGGAFAVAVQFAAMAGSGRAIMSRIEVTGLWLGDADSPWLWPARAATGEVGPLVAMLGASGGMLGLAILAMAPRFGRQVLAASEVTAAVPGPLRGPMRGRSRWRGASPAQALRRKEWTLLLRDPWLLSQTLMQLLYLLPVGYMLWLNFYRATGASAFLVPIMIVTAGQLGGGLAWLAVSAEDAPELIATAPVAGGTVLRAKTTAVLGGIGVIFGPFVLVLAALAPADGLAALGGVTAAAASATAIQYWFRTQVKRSLFRRRQTSSKVATIAEALSSTGWAATGALAAAPTWLALVPGALVLVILAGVWAISPGREARGI